MFKVWLILTFVLVVGCQQQPVKVKDISHSRFQFLRQKLDEPLLVTSKTVVIDSRPKFDYMMYSVPGALHLLWQQLLQNPEGDSSVVTGQKAFSAATRLAWLGVGPDSEVIVLGQDVKGQADAGRLAWSLLTLGFKNVQVSALNNMSKLVSPFQERTHKTIPIWKPNANGYLFEINQASFLQAVSVKNPEVVILDVRSEQEFKSQASLDFSKNYPGYNSKLAPWTDFYTQRGRPSQKMIKHLFNRGVSFNNEIIVVSNNGVRSGAVSFALLSLGFKRVRNFSQGLNSVLK